MPDDIPSSDAIMFADPVSDITEVNSLGEVTTDGSLAGAIDSATYDMGFGGSDPFAFRMDSYGRIDGWGNDSSGGGGGGAGGGGGGGGGGGYQMNYAPTLGELGVPDGGSSVIDGSSLNPNDLGLKPGSNISVGNFDSEQVRNASIIADVGHKLGASRWDIAVALMAAMTESNLRNLDHGDRDSVGLFQQRDAWGSFDQRTNPAEAARMFFQGGHAGQRGLFDFEDRRNMGLGAAAQAVQVSAYPDRYDQFADDALAVLNHIRDEQRSGANVADWRKQVIGSARKMIGVPYVWGGTSYSGVDCSGLVQLMYKKVGINLPRISAAQAASGPRIPLDELQPGDLVGWDNSSRNNGADHIAIYIGNGQIIEAARPGTLVHISPLYDTGRAWGVSMAQYDPLAPRRPQPRPDRGGSRTSGGSSGGGGYTTSSGAGSSHYSSSGGGGSSHSSQPSSGGHPVGDPTPSHGGHVKPPPKPPTHNGGGHTDPNGPII